MLHERRVLVLYMSGCTHTLCLIQEYQGDYEWMLYGHDDTFFFVDGALDLLQDFDPSLPYIITGMVACLSCTCSVLQSEE